MADKDKTSIEQHDAEEAYNSSEDGDFNPDAAEAEAPPDEDVSSSEDDDTTPQPKRAPPKKRKKPQTNVQELDSGDEATITELKRSKKLKTHGEQNEEQDSGGEGGLIKTRAQRRAEKQERQEYQRANVGHVTVDVDALWATMTAKPLGRPSPEKQKQETDKLDQQKADGEPATQAQEADDGLITIKRSYDFAGQKVTEEKRVHKDSAEAKLFLANNNNPSDKNKPRSQTPFPNDDQPAALRRPLRRASKFEPNPTGEVKGLPLERQRLRTPSRADVLLHQKRLEEESRKGKAVKLNTVQKSAIDWAAHVDQQGLKEELDEYGRSKQGYIGKMDFLRGVHGKKEEEERKARMAQSSA